MPVIEHEVLVFVRIPHQVYTVLGAFQLWRSVAFMGRRGRREAGEVGRGGENEAVFSELRRQRLLARHM